MKFENAPVTKSSMHAPSLRDIANAAGVHISTVSRALRNENSIPLTTRMRIRSLADSMGYRPNPLTSALMEARRKGSSPRFRATLGMLSFKKKEDVYKDGAWLFEVFKGVKRYARSMGYEVEIFWMGDERISMKHFNNILLTRNLQGLILPPEHEVSLPLEIDWDKFAVVSLHMGKPNSLPWFHQVVSNHGQSIDRVCKECFKLGYKRPGLVLVDHPRRHYQFGRVVYGSFKASVAKCPIEDQVPPLVVRELSREAFDRWLVREKPDCVIMTGGGYRPENHPAEYIEIINRRSSELGIKIGLAALCQQPGDEVAGINQRMVVLGERAARLLIDMITRNERGIPDDPMLHLVNGHWYATDSLPPKRD